MSLTKKQEQELNKLEEAIKINSEHLIEETINRVRVVTNLMLSNIKDGDNKDILVETIITRFEGELGTKLLTDYLKNDLTK